MSDFVAVFEAILWVGVLFALLYVAYRCGLGLLSLRPRRPAQLGDGSTVFAIMVSAHNEENVIADTVRSLLALDYPAEKRRLFVVADDCSDRTAEAASAAGATVLVKPAPAMGKGTTIHWALRQPQIQEAEWSALVLFDADSRPGVSVLRYFDGALQDGAKAIQGRSESARQSGWVARGYSFNNTQRNRIWHQAREMAGLSAALTGTGICLTRELLRAFPPVTRTLTEDLEYSAMLTAAGIRVSYLYDAMIRIEQPHSLKSSVHQRLRWARGQIRTTFVYAPGLLRRAVTKLDLSAFDTALYLALPSLVPFQAGLLTLAIGETLAPDVWPSPRIEGLPEIPAWLMATGFAASVLLAYAGVTAEHRKADWRDWLAFLLLMGTWLPIAVLAAMTTQVKRWYRTPHGVSEPDLPVTVTAREDEAQPPPVRSGTPG